MTARHPEPRIQGTACELPLVDRGSDSSKRSCDQVKARLRAVREQRKGGEHEAAQLPSLLRAIALVRRDRDAGASRVLLAQRAELERVHTEVEDLIFAVVRTAIRAYVRGDSGEDPVVRRAHRAIDSALQALRLLTYETEHLA
jgi:hypothetical protein